MSIPAWTSGELFRLEGRVAFVTGAGTEGGIGRAIGLAFAGAGARVGLGDIDGGAAAAAARAVLGAGGQACAVGLDVTDPASVTAAVDAVQAKLGEIDILVNCAGITRSTPIWELTLKEFDQVMDVNLRGGFICLQAVLEGMMRRRRGRLIWLSSVAGKQGGGHFGSSHYAASKAGVIGLCQGAARELGPYGITSNAIAPGFVTTGMVARAGGAAAENAVASRALASTPLGRLGNAGDIAAVAVFLASEAAAFVTGEILDVNGGQYLD